MKAYLSLGSNMGDREGYLEKALEFLDRNPGITVLKVSSFYETEPWGGVDQDSFFNLAVEIETTLDPFDLLKECQTVENSLGRRRLVRWGPRVIDIDILLYGNLKVKSKDLIIPHPLMEEREFVLAPLREIAPDLILPSGKPVQKVRGEGKVIKKVRRKK